MRAMRLERPAPIAERPLILRDFDQEQPAPGELALRVKACAVCRTDLQLCRRGRRGPPAADHAGAPGRRDRRGDWRGCARLEGWRSRGRGMARRRGWRLSLLRQRAREPLPQRDLHRLGPRRRLRRAHHCARRLRAAPARQASATLPPRRCSAAGSSATARSSVRASSQVDGLASTASARRHASPSRWRGTGAARSTCVPARRTSRRRRWTLAR